MANPASRDDPSGPSGQPAKAREWSAIRQALAATEAVESIVELSGTSASFAQPLANAGYRVTRIEGLPDVADSPALPLAAKSADALLSADFPFHLEADLRRRRLREYGRVSRWVILECRHRYSARGLAGRLGLVREDMARASVKSLHSDFEDAGLRIMKVIAVQRWISDRWVVLAEAGHIDPESLALRLRHGEYQGLEITAKLGEGKRSVVYRARWRGREVSVKVYKPAAIARHARKHRLPLAEFEHRRNKAFFDARGMARFVAEPLGFVVEPGFQMTLQECLDGELYYFAQRDQAAFISPDFLDDLAELVKLSHEAQLYDIDLHAMNVMVDRQTGGPKLFDFNQIPFNERPQNPLVSLALKLGLLGKHSRDLRKLAQLRDFGRVERRLLKFYEDGN